MILIKLLYLDSKRDFNLFNQFTLSFVVFGWIFRPKSSKILFIQHERYAKDYLNDIYNNLVLSFCVSVPFQMWPSIYRRRTGKHCYPDHSICKSHYAESFSHCPSDNTYNYVINCQMIDGNVTEAMTVCLTISA